MFCLGLEEDVHFNDQAIFVIVWVQRVRVDVFLQRSHGEDPVNGVMVEKGRRLVYLGWYYGRVV